VPRLRPRQPAPQRSRRQVQHPLGPPRLPAPFHPWSFQAAVNARWFDTKSKKLGDDYRDAVFANQPSITTLDVLRDFTEKFAADHKIACPSPSTPRQAHRRGQSRLRPRPAHRHRTHPHHLGRHRQSKGAPFVEVVDRTKLYQLIDQALADTRASNIDVTSINESFVP
jgi:hypothetical protein